MSATFQNSAMVLSIGIFFTLIIVGLSSRLPSAMYSGLTAQGVPAAVASRVSHLPPTGALFAALLGYNPMGSLLGPALHNLPAGKAAYLTGRGFFPDLISGPFHAGLVTAFAFALAACIVAAVASWLRGGKYHHGDDDGTAGALAGSMVSGTPTDQPLPADGPVTMTDGASSVPADHGASR
jgi:hypothetical protein